MTELATPESPVRISLRSGYLLQYSHTSFLCYLSHGPVILLICLAYNAGSLHLPYIFYGLTVPIAMVLLVVAAYRRIARHVPKIGNVLLGGCTT